MWKKHKSSFQYHVKYIYKDIFNPLRLSILQYIKRIHDMHDLVKYLPPPSKKGDMFYHLYYRIHAREFMEGEIHVATNIGLPQYIYYGMWDKDKYYHHFIHEEWWYLLSTLEAKKTGRGMLTRSKVCPTRRLCWIIIVIQVPGLHARRRLGLTLCRPTIRIIKNPSMEESSATFWFARRM